MNTSFFLDTVHFICSDTELSALFYFLISKLRLVLHGPNRISLPMADVPVGE